jgi:hypothetical protein
MLVTSIPSKELDWLSTIVLEMSSSKVVNNGVHKKMVLPQNLEAAPQSTAQN